jgi:putative nucleotidyltransferase with HDIG domain
VIAASHLDMRHRLEEEVPPFRPVAVQLLHLAGDPTVSTGRIVNLLQTDPVLTMGLLRVANSPLFAARYEISDVRQAVTYLGLDLVRSLAVTASMRGLIDTRPNRLAVGFWRHSLATALACRKMCRLAGVPPESAYTAGLLHDVGQLGLMRLFPDYAETVGGAVGRGDSLIDAEARALGTDHCQAGRWLLSRWRLPLELQNVAAGHERPSSKATCDRALIMVVHAASLAAELMGFAVIPPAREIEPQDVAAGFAEDRRQDLLESLPEWVEWVLLHINGIETSLLS